MKKPNGCTLNLGLLALAVSCGGSSQGDDSDDATGGASVGGTGAVSGNGASSGTGVGGGGAVSGEGGTGGSGIAGSGIAGAATGGGGTGGSPTCGGPPPGAMGGGSSENTYEQTQCYLSELADGAPDCLPPNDPALVPMLQDYISSSGFVVTFVIEAGETIRMPAACEPLVACCTPVTPEYKQTQCYDWLDGAGEMFTVDGCPVAGPNFKEYFGCAAASGETGGDVETGAGGAGGVGEEPARYRCCYETCGYTHYN